LAANEQSIDPSIKMINHQSARSSVAFHMNGLIDIWAW